MASITGRSISGVIAYPATGIPQPTYALAPGAPSWLKIDAATGNVFGAPPTGTSSFDYAVVASNGTNPAATTPNFHVTVSEPWWLKFLRFIFCIFFRIC